MPTPTDEELINRINTLSSRIQQHKTHRSAPYTPRANAYHIPRGRGRGRGRAIAPNYRNRTLILNGSGQPQSRGEGDSDASSSSWVTKKDRHLQLINSNVYEKESQDRTQKIEQTRLQKMAQVDQKEKFRVLEHVRRSNLPTASSINNYEIEVEGIRFLVTRQGSKLVRITDGNRPLPTPKTTLVGGVRFHRTKNGNLIRHGVAKAHRMVGGVKKVNEICKAFSWTGSCHKGPQCRYIHDPSRVAICRDWLLKGSCQNGDACDLSHETTDERTPLCLHYAKGNCNNDACPYVHAEHSPADLVCRNFGIYGYCEKGAQCSDRHVFECPDFSNSGICKTKGCKLLHRERASVL